MRLITGEEDVTVGSDLKNFPEFVNLLSEKVNKSKTRSKRIRIRNLLARKRPVVTGSNVSVESEHRISDPPPMVQLRVQISAKFGLF